MKYPFLFSLSIILALVSSCTTYTTIEVSYNQLPQTDFRLDSSQHILVNNALEQASQITIDLLLDRSHHQHQTLQVERQADLTTHALVSLGSQLQENYLKDQVLLYQEGKALAAKAYYYLSDEELDFLAQQGQCDWVLSLDSLVYATRIKEERLPDLGLVVAQLSIHTHPYFSLYRASDPQFYRAFTLTDSLSWSSQGLSLQHAVDALPSLTACLQDAMYFAVLSCVEQWTPQHYTLSRRYIHLANSYFREAKQLLNSGKANDAAYMWEYVTQHSQDQDQLLAAYYNISLYLEQQGQWGLAAVWLEKAMAHTGLQSHLLNFDLQSHLARLKNGHLR